MEIDFSDRGPVGGNSFDILRKYYQKQKCKSHGHCRNLVQRYSGFRKSDNSGEVEKWKSSALNGRLNLGDERKCGVKCSA